MPGPIGPDGPIGPSSWPEPQRKRPPRSLQATTQTAASPPAGTTQVPVTPSPWRPMVQVAPAARPVHASTAAGGGVRTRPHTSTPDPPAATQTPLRLSPKASSTVQASPAAFAAQAATSSSGGAGGFGAQATAVPSMVVRQVPATSRVVPSEFVEVRVQALPAAF